MKTLYASILVAVLSLLFNAPVSANLQDPEPEKKGFEKKNFDRKGPQKQSRPMGPHGGDRRGGHPEPFLMAGDPRFEQMLKLALVDKDKLDEAMEKWPRMDQMSDMEKRKFIRRVTMFREKLRKQAMEEAEQLGLDIPEDKKVEYFRSYWTARMQLEQKIRSDAKERHEAEMKALRKKLQQEW